MNKMKKILAVCLLAMPLLALTKPAAAELSVFACEPEWGALAKELGVKRPVVERWMAGATRWMVDVGRWSRQMAEELGGLEKRGG